VTKRCETEKQEICHGACFDGWSNSCYFDSSSSTPDPKLALDSQKEKCFAYYENSVCAPCKNNHLLNKDGVFKKVSCEEFYQQINTNNVTCDGCLKYIFNAGG